MKIIKATGDDEADATLIAQEMFNIEAAALVYNLGGEHPPVPIQGYPKIIRNDVHYTIHAAAGCLLLPVIMEGNEFEKLIAEKIQKMDTENHLHNYHSFNMGSHTNIKVKSHYKNTTLSPRYGLQSKRQFITTKTTGAPDMRRMRFRWYIKNIKNVLDDISNNTVECAITEHICSIFYDKFNICTLPNFAVTFEYTRNLLVGSEHIRPYSFTLTNLHNNPLAIESSSAWKSTFNTTKWPCFRNIPRRKVFSAPYEAIKLSPIKTETDVLTGNICSKCQSLLYGDNYVLYGNINATDQNLGTAICALCLHMSTTPLEDKYSKILRVTFPTKMSDFIEEQKDPVLRDIYTNIMKGLRRVTIVDDNQITLNFLEIGDDWLGFVNLSDYIHSSFSTKNKRKVVQLTTMNLIK